MPAAPDFRKEAARLAQQAEAVLICDAHKIARRLIFAEGSGSFALNHSSAVKANRPTATIRPYK